MITKNKHSRELITGKNHPILELFFEFAQLKNLYRQGWLKRGIEHVNCETVAEHSFSVGLLGYVIAEEHRQDLDSLRVMKLGLFHEMGEIYAGDIIPSDKISKEEKFAREYAAVQKVFAHLPNSRKYENIWMEFEKKETPEAIFVGQIDRLEMALQANLYKQMGYGGLEEFFPYVQQRITSPELKSIMDEILKVK